MTDSLAKPNPNLVTWKEALAYLRCSDSTLRRYVNERLIARIKLRGRILFDKAELDAFLRRSTQ